MAPSRVVELQCLAMQQYNPQVYWRFVSPEGKRSTGVLRPSRRPYLTPPTYSQLPLYVPLVRSHNFKIVGALPISADRYQCRVRVWPSGGERECGGDPLPLMPVEYIWRLALQPLVRPTCYEDDPMQQGISTGPPFAGCWLVDDIQLDDRWGGTSGDDAGAPVDPTGGGSLKLSQKWVRRFLALSGSS